MILKNKFLLLFTSFATGIVLMVLEMVGSRMLAPYFGNSVYVWGNLIGVVMFSMAIVYFVGGKVADRFFSWKLLFFVILFASLWVLMTIFFYKTLLSTLVDLGVVFGSMLSVVVLFSIPMCLLSFVSPYITKFISDDKNVGFSAGLVSSIFTIGSIFGVYLAVFVLIPVFGVRNSLIISFLFMLLISILGLVLDNWKFIILALLSLSLLLIPDYFLAESIIFEKESLYNHVVVKEKDGILGLFLNKDKVIHSLNYEKGLYPNNYYKAFSLLPLLTEVKDLLILGMGAGTSVNQFEFYYPEIRIDAVEIDGGVIGVGEEYFGIKSSDKLQIFEEDARLFLWNTDKKYNAIEIDLFQGSFYIPFYTATAEFFELVYGSLENGGVIAMNVIDSSSDRKLLNSIENTVLTVFPSVFEIDFNKNFVVFAFKGNISIEELERMLKSDNIDLQNFIDMFEFIKVDKSTEGVIFTDDYAPVEKLSKEMLEFI
ncbi:fused MFS/spermidine synthase [Patescibacteria group bacterium]|nr:fused MFS/spermidine synthase [Patescibacteria group bacterium]